MNLIVEKILDQFEIERTTKEFFKERFMPVNMTLDEENHFEALSAIEIKWKQKQYEREHINTGQIEYLREFSLIIK